VQFNPVGTSKFTSPCDVAKSALVKRGVPYLNQHSGDASRQAPAPGAGDERAATITVGTTAIPSYDATAADAKAQGAAFDKALDATLKTAGYPAKAAPEQVNKPMLTLLLWILVIYVTMVYGPIAAMLVELFPTKIRYTSMSLPYHIGNGWFGGMLPLLATAVVAATGDIYAGLWYPIGVAVMTLIVGAIFLRDTKGVDMVTSSGVAIQKT
jgi:hypothetical protein